MVNPPSLRSIVHICTVNIFLSNSFIEKTFPSNLLNDSLQNISNNAYVDKEVTIIPIYVEHNKTLAYLIQFPKPNIKLNKNKLKELKIAGNLMKDFLANG